MELLIVSLLSFAVLLIGLTLCVLQLRAQAKAHTSELDRMHRLLDKAVVMLTTKDPLAYQNVQFMDGSRYDEPQGVFDPSEEAEMARIQARMNPVAGEDALNGSERAADEAFALDDRDSFFPGF
jgi:hypothetical protein